MFTMILLYSSKCMWISSFVVIGFCVSELHAHLGPYHNVWPEVVLQELQCLQCCLHVDIIRVIGIYHFTKFRSSNLPVSEIAKCIA